MTLLVASFHLLRTKIVLAYEKACKYFFHDCMKSFFLVLTSSKIRGNLKNNQFLLEKTKNSK